MPPPNTLLRCSLIFALFTASCRHRSVDLEPKVALAPAREAPVPLRVSAGRLTSTSEGWSTVSVPGMRAESAIAGTSDVAELRFVYRGPTAASSPLADGTLRRQIGIKLRARDTCNVVYVMWHIAPTVGIHVSVKSNPDAERHDACGARGYANVLPAQSRPVAEVSRFAPHVLRATIRDDLLEVTVDRTVAWLGTLPPSARTLRGPIGVRSDNGEFDFTLRGQ